MLTTEKIIELASAQHLSLKELARRADIPYTTLYSIVKRGSVPKYDMLLNIAHALGVSIGQLDDRFSEDAMFQAIEKGELSESDIAYELGLSVDVLHEAIYHPESVPDDLREKILLYSGLLVPELKRITVSSLSDAALQIAAAYDRADDRARQVVNLTLEPFFSPEEKEDAQELARQIIRDRETGGQSSASNGAAGKKKEA